MTPYGERIVRVEDKVSELDVKMERIEAKLDQLLTLKNKGAGAFWLVSLIFTSILFAYGIGLFKGVFFK